MASVLWRAPRPQARHVEALFEKATLAPWPCGSLVAPSGSGPPQSPKGLRWNTSAFTSAPWPCGPLVAPRRGFRDSLEGERRRPHNARSIFESRRPAT